MPTPEKGYTRGPYNKDVDLVKVTFRLTVEQIRKIEQVASTLDIRKTDALRLVIDQYTI